MRVRALKDVTYAQTNYKPGDEFDTIEDLHGTLLMRAEAVEAVTAASEDKPKRGRYRTRDMRAEE